MRVHHRFLLRQGMKLLKTLAEQIAAGAEESARRLDPLEWGVELWVTVSGLARRAARNLIAEIGGTWTGFPAAAIWL